MFHCLLLSVDVENDGTNSLRHQGAGWLPGRQCGSRRARPPVPAAPSHWPVLTPLCFTSGGPRPWQEARGPGPCAQAPHSLPSQLPVWLSLKLLSALCSEMLLPVRSSLTAHLNDAQLCLLCSRDSMSLLLSL